MPLTPSCSLPASRWTSAAHLPCIMPVWSGVNTGESPRWQQRPDKVVPEWSFSFALIPERPGRTEPLHRELKSRGPGTSSHHAAIDLLVFIQIFTLEATFQHHPKRLQSVALRILVASNTVKSSGVDLKAFERKPLKESWHPSYLI